MKRRDFFLRTFGIGVLSVLPGCASLWREPGPGMIVTFTSVKKDRVLYIEKGITSNGIFFPTPGSLGYSRTGWGATMGGSSDGRQLPEWVEFEWSESEVGRKYSGDELRALPIQRFRVRVRERVPPEIVEQAIAARREARPGTLPEKDLWIYFEWADDGIRFHWRLLKSRPDRGTDLLGEGGDPVRAK